MPNQHENIVTRFFANADRLGAKTCMVYPAGQGWAALGWRASAQLVRDFGSALVSLGHKPGSTLAILAQTRREWIMCDLGNLAVGGVTVGVYPTMTDEQTRYVIAHSGARVVVVEDKKQMDKLKRVRAQLPDVEHVISMEPLDGALLLSDVLARGRDRRADVDSLARNLRYEDLALLIYTSGTTGPPKGAMLTHGNLVSGLRSTVDALELEDDSQGFSFLPLAHTLQRLVDFQGLWRGIGGAYGRGIDTVAEDLAINRPTVMAAVPRIFEKVYGKISEQVAAGSKTKRSIFKWALGVGKTTARLKREGRPVPAVLLAQQKLAHQLVFAKLQQKLGGKIRIFVTGGAPIATEILEFFAAADLCILEAWGMTETFGVGSLNLPGHVKFGTIGRPLPGVEMKLDVDGEILIRGGNVFKGYYKDAEATKAAFTDDGFFRTGDIGKIDDEGYFTIIDRKKDLIITAAGKNIAPQNIENLIKSDPRVSQVMVVGDRRPYLVALITVAPELRNGKPDAELISTVQQIIEAKNQELSQYERIKKFRLLPVDLTQEAGELTPTLKVKRKVVGEKYAPLITEMYAEGK